MRHPGTPLAPVVNCRRKGVPSKNNGRQRMYGGNVNKGRGRADGEDDVGLVEERIQKLPKHKLKKNWGGQRRAGEKKKGGGCV